MNNKFFFFLLLTQIIYNTAYFKNSPITISNYMDKILKNGIVRLNKDLSDMNSNIVKIDSFLKEIDSDIELFESLKQTLSDYDIQNQIEEINLNNDTIPVWVRNVLTSSNEIVIIKKENRYYARSKKLNYYDLKEGDHNLVIFTQNGTDVLFGYDKNFRVFKRFKKSLES